MSMHCNLNMSALYADTRVPSYDCDGIIARIYAEVQRHYCLSIMNRSAEDDFICPWTVLDPANITLVAVLQHCGCTILGFFGDFRVLA